jgi:hypothetical protein
MISFLIKFIFFFYLNSKYNFKNFRKKNKKQKMNEELTILIKKLRDESAFVLSEKKHILDLYRQVN